MIRHMLQTIKQPLQGVNSGCKENVVVAIVVDKLKLQTTIHPKPYLAGWILNGHQQEVTKQYKIPFSVGGVYFDEFVFDVINMDVSHVILRRP